MKSGPGNNVILLKQKTLLKTVSAEQNEQDTTHKSHLWHGSLAGNLILVSAILLCSATDLYLRWNRISSSPYPLVCQYQLDSVIWCLLLGCYVNKAKERIPLLEDVQRCDWHQRTSVAQLRLHSCGTLWLGDQSARPRRRQCRHENL